MSTPSTRTRRGPLLVLVVAFMVLVALPVVIATIGLDEEHDVAGAAGTTTEVPPSSVDLTTTSEPATTTTEPAPTTTEATAPAVPETTTTTIDLAAVYDYAAKLEQAKATPPPTRVVEYIEVTQVQAAPEPEPAEEPQPEPEAFVETPAPVAADGDPFAGISWSDRQFLECVKSRESRGDYGAVNPSSGAGGAYQFLRNTWNNTATHAGRGDLVGLPPQYATPYDQDFLAAHLIQWYGRSPWSYSC